LAISIAESINRDGLGLWYYYSTDNGIIRRPENQKQTQQF